MRKLLSLTSEAKLDAGQKKIEELLEGSWHNLTKSECKGLLKNMAEYQDFVSSRPRRVFSIWYRSALPCIKTFFCLGARGVQGDVGGLF